MGPNGSRTVKERMVRWRIEIRGVEDREIKGNRCSLKELNENRSQETSPTRETDFNRKKDDRGEENRLINDEYEVQV